MGSTGELSLSSLVSKQQLTPLKLTILSNFLYKTNFMYILVGSADPPVPLMDPPLYIYKPNSNGICSNGIEGICV